MTSTIMQKRLGKLWPVDGDSVLQHIPEGDMVRVKITRPRNVQQHRLFFALLHLVYENQDHYEQFEHMLTALKVALGHCDTVICRDGKVAYLPKSISFAKMDQTEFQAFFDKTVDIVCRHFIPGVKDENLKREVYEMTGIAA